MRGGWLAGPLAAGALGACASVNTLGRARTLEAGESRLVGGLEVGWVDSRPFATPLLRADAGLRYGLADGVEVGAHAGGWPLVVQWGQVGADLKVALARSSDPSRGMDLSLALAGQLDGVNGGGLRGWGWAVQLPLLIDLNDGPRRTWLLSPRLVWQGLYSEGASPVVKPYGGLSLGLSLERERITLQPQVGLLWSDNPADRTGGMGTLSFGLAVSM